MNRFSDTTLHITNGESTLGLMAAAGIEGDAFSWDDVLHEGPVQDLETLSELSKLRTQFIAAQGWASNQQANDKFVKRDSQLEGFANYQHVYLWFEHDLYDQLQLIQILEWFNRQKQTDVKLFGIFPGRHLGHHSIESFRALSKTATPINQAQLNLATQAWRGFTAEEPRQLNELIKQDKADLPFLPKALKRLAAEFPSLESGIPMTESLILKCLQDAEKELTLGQLFQAYTKAEEDEFLGDLIFLTKINQMIFSDKPLLKVETEFPLRSQASFQLAAKPTQYAIYLMEKGGDWFIEAEESKAIGGMMVDFEQPFRWNGSQIKLK